MMTNRLLMFAANVPHVVFHTQRMQSFLGKAITKHQPRQDEKRFTHFQGIDLHTFSVDLLILVDH